MIPLDQERILRDNRRISILVEQWSNTSLVPWGLTAAQAQILLYILRHREGGTSLTQIHRDFGYSMAALSGIIKRLREKGYVRAEFQNGDGRCKRLFPTPAARDLQEHLDRSSAQVRQQLWRCFTPQELHNLDCLQRKLLSSLCTLTHQAKEEPS